MSANSPLIFEAPHARTLFLLESAHLRIITYDGEEVLLPLADLIAWQLHLTIRQAAALAVKAETLCALAQVLAESSGVPR